VLNPQYSPKEGTGAATGSLKDYLCDKLSPDLPIDVRELPMEVPGYQSTLSHFQSCQAHACMVHRPPMGGCTAIEHQLLPATRLNCVAVVGQESRALSPGLQKACYAHATSAWRLNSMELESDNPTSPSTISATLNVAH